LQSGVFESTSVKVLAIKTFSKLNLQEVSVSLSFVAEAMAANQPALHPSTPAI
jgi:hypothetical protein